uniref:NADH dehydrogenase [ubiquinone] 1 alpha subcomplex subunit 2 n=1 Tax=Eptatretus burgeri TaxID=7764 RepID=A0A8C4QU58_EPTBU
MAAALIQRSFTSAISQHVRELRFHLCQTAPSSRGVREFIEQYYVPLKQANPALPLLVRESSGVQPRLWARYAFGQEETVSLKNMTAEQVAQAVKQLAKPH